MDRPAKEVRVNQTALPFGRRWVMAVVGAVLIAGGWLGISLSPLNRIYAFWGWMDTVAVLMLPVMAGTRVPSMGVNSSTERSWPESSDSNRSERQGRAREGAS